jgi:hypothetical protein
MYKRLIPATAAALLLMTSGAHAAKFAVITAPPTMLSAAILIFAAVGLVWSYKVVDLVRGGLFSKCWQMFVGGFLALALAQAVALLRAFEIVALPSFIVPALLVLMALLFMYGVFEARRTLG